MLNSKKAELPISRIIQSLIAMTVIVIVIFSLKFQFYDPFFNPNNDKNQIYQVKEKECDIDSRLIESEFKVCVDSNDIICNEKERKEWKDAESYLDNKNCENQECTCIQKIIFDLKNDNSNNNFEKNPEVLSSNSDINCDTESYSFDPNNIKFSPYWVTTVGETGSSNLLSRVDQIAIDASNSKSYGNFGLNSNSGAISFWNEYGSQLNLYGTPSSNEGAESWKNVAESDPKNLALAEVRWYNDHIIDNVISTLNSKGFPDPIKNDPRVIAYLSDVTIQEGATLRNSLIDTIKPNGPETVESYLLRLAEYQSSDDYLNKRFKTYLSENPDAIGGLKNRIMDKRYPLSLQVTIVKIEESSKEVCYS